MTTDYKDTLNLPRTGFEMKAGLIEREPRRLQQWESRKLYRQIQAARAGGPKFVLHDGPPFANGDVHVGTALNKILKDFIIKYKTLRGFSAPYIPGWDCHGLPIEFKVTQEMRKAGKAAAGAAEIRKACEASALKFVDAQRAQFKRLGVFGDWENPYLTLDRKYEADELRMFADIVEKGYVYRGKKPVYWSIPCRTALAEAEVEYADHVSQSVFVKFPVIGEPGTFIVIWTTTPWTLPANLAVAYNKDFEYVRVRAGQGAETFIVAKCRLEEMVSKGVLPGVVSMDARKLSAEELGRLEYQHPFCDRSGMAFAAAFVTSDTGTGFVHIAPGHGLDDYNLGRQNGLPIYSPVNDDGAFAHTGDLPVGRQMPAVLLGKAILGKRGKMGEADEAVLALLREKNVLLGHEEYHHSYPHCWRSKTPVIFRAMDQWFIKVDHSTPELEAGGGGGLRGKASRVTSDPKDPEKVTWIPGWGESRILGALQARPDWCISRQRSWGVPIPAFYDASGAAILDARIARNTADLFEKHGSNIWFEKSAAELWPLVKPRDWDGPPAAAKSADTLDVWIDSGSSSRSVLKRREELRHEGESGDGVWRADMYLEGSDQHRGWFQSSLLLSLAGNGAAPFKTVLTHGFMVDADREKISKSRQEQGGYEKPQTAESYVGRHGADIIRLWVASQDFRDDIVVSEERLSKVGETYRAIRNALRYQLSNLYDYIPAEHAVADEELTGLDRWMLGGFSGLESEVAAAYERYEFHVVYQKVSQFIAVELSSIYHDAIKDRLYTGAANSTRRRSTQTALHRMARGLCLMLSPILVFTADEAWECIPGCVGDSVHLSLWGPGSFTMTEKEQETWRRLFEIRPAALACLEKARQAKVIGKALEARLVVDGPAEALGGLTDEDKESLRELLNVSRLELNERAGGGGLSALAAKADGKKCGRCWHWETDVGASVEHPMLCGRCVEAVRQAVTSA